MGEQGKKSRQQLGRIGGRIRAERLSPRRRTEIARKAAKARWAGQEKPLKALHSGVLSFGAGVDVECAVLEDERRVIGVNAMMKALKRTKSGHATQLSHGAQLPVFLSLNALTPFVSEELRLVSKAIPFQRRGEPVSQGVDATALPAICGVWIDAHEAGVLRSTQLKTVKRAQAILRALASVGIVALVDEATGYQEHRDKQALQALLDRYLRKELAAWAKRFPDEFYKGIFRLRGWEWQGMQVNRPQVVGHYTKDLVYARLAPGIVDELERRMPKVNGRRTAKMHQWLTEDVGHPALAQHIHAIVTLMRVSRDWKQFMSLVDLAHPRRGDTLKMPFMAD